MIASSNQPQMFARDLAGAASGARRAQAPVVGNDFQDWSPVRRRAGFIDDTFNDASSKVTGRASARSFSHSHTKGLIILRRRPAARSLLPRAAGRHLEIGFVGSIDDLADDIAFTRAGAFVGRRPRFLNTPDHVARQSIDPAKTHHQVPSSPLVAVEANHRPKGFRIVRTAFREAGNVIRS